MCRTVFQWQHSEPRTAIAERPRTNLATLVAISRLAPFAKFDHLAKSPKHPHHHVGMNTPWTHTSLAHHAGTHHTSSAHHAGAHHTSSTHHAGAHRSFTPTVVLLLLQHLWLLLHHRPLLGTRSDSATSQNESRRGEHQNVLLHFKSPQKHTPSH
jgi:hypothetical protein